MNLLARIDRVWRAPAPAERLATLRWLVGAYALVYLLARAPLLGSYARFAPERFEPVGIATLLEQPLPQALVVTSLVLAIASGVAFTLGFAFRLSGPLFALSFLWVTTYRNSWGMIFHTDNLVALHLFVLALGPSSDTLALRTRRKRSAEPRAYGWPVHLMCVLTVLTYVLAGVAKVRNAGWDWADGEVLRNYVAFDALRKIQMGSIHSPLGAAAVQHAALFAPLAWLTLLLELGAPLSLVHRRIATAWVMLAWAFHAGVLALMAIVFPYPLSGIAFASFFRVEALWRWPKLARVHAWLQTRNP